MKEKVKGGLVHVKPVKDDGHPCSISRGRAWPRAVNYPQGELYDAQDIWVRGLKPVIRFR